MNDVAKKLHRGMASKADRLSTKEPKRRPGALLPGGYKDVQMLIKEDGLHPIHAVYVSMQNLTSHFAEVVSDYPEMKLWQKTVGDAEDEYMPSGPPINPLAMSYFWMWALYDVRIGKTNDTIARCQIALNDLIQMNEHQFNAAKKLETSRMGLYEQVGTEGPNIRLRELLTDRLLWAPR